MLKNNLQKRRKTKTQQPSNRHKKHKFQDVLLHCHDVLALSFSLLPDCIIRFAFNKSPGTFRNCHPLAFPFVWLWWRWIAQLYVFGSTVLSDIYTFALASAHHRCVFIVVFIVVFFVYVLGASEIECRNHRRRRRRRRVPCESVLFQAKQPHKNFI